MVCLFERLSRVSRAVALGAVISLGAVAAAQDTTSTAGQERIVSLNGSNTELLFALGLGDQVVARDISATYPPAIHKLPSIGYQYGLNVEGILSMKPTIVVGRSDVKPPTVPQQLMASGVRVELIDEPQSLEDGEARIARLGEIFGKQAEAKALIDEMNADLEKFKARKAELGDKVAKKAVFLYLRGPKVTFVLGKDSSVAGMLDAVGVNNVLGEVGKSAPITAESLIAAAPEVIITFTHGLESVGGMDGLLKLPGVAQTPAGKNKRIIAMNDAYLGGMTDRAGKAALDLLNAVQAEGVVRVEPGK